MLVVMMSTCLLGGGGGGEDGTEGRDPVRGDGRRERSGDRRRRRSRRSQGVRWCMRDVVQDVGVTSREAVDEVVVHVWITSQVMHDAPATLDDRHLI